MKKILTGVWVILLFSVFVAVTPAFAVQGDIGNIELNDITTSLNFYDAGPIHHAWASYPEGLDTWSLKIATSYDALVEITWFDWYPTNDIYELWVDGVLKGTNTAGGTGTVQLKLATGSTYTVLIKWIAYQTNQPIIPGGSYYDISFTVLSQFPPLWVKASGGGEFYDDYSSFKGHHCTIGLIGMSLTAVPQGVTTDYKGSGVFVDHDLKLIIHLDITTGRLTTTAKKEVQFWGTARVKDIDLKDKWTGTFWVGLVDDEYGVTNRFAIHLWQDGGSKYGVWHGTLLPESEVTVWFWE